MLKKSAKGHRYLHAFVTYPKVKFETQQKGEQVVLILRAHPFTQLHWIINIVLVLILIFLSNIFIKDSFSLGQILFLNLFMLIVILSYGWLNFLSWFFNLGLITNRRLIDLDYQPITYREVTGTHLEKVEDITSKSGGFFASIFNYGDVYIQTAGTEPNIEFLSVPAPGTVVEIINELMGEL